MFAALVDIAKDSTPKLKPLNTGSGQVERTK